MGFNVENAAYEGCSHAETVAEVTMLAAGEDEIAVVLCVGFVEGKEDEPVIGLPPCGGCRQKLYEFKSLANRDLNVVIKNPHTGLLEIRTIDELLPYAFGPADLAIELAKYRRRG